jgi:hypothetical protein
MDIWFQFFFYILEDTQLIGKLRNTLKMVTRVGGESEGCITTNLPERHSHRVKKRERRTLMEFRLDAPVEGYEIKDVMLDLGSDVNILLKKS